MAADISVYSFEDRDGNEYGTFTTQDYQEAKAYAAENKLRVMENVYEWSEAIPVEGDDYTGADDEEEVEYGDPIA